MADADDKLQYAHAGACTARDNLRALLAETSAEPSGPLKDLYVRARKLAEDLDAVVNKNKLSYVNVKPTEGPADLSDPGS